MISERLVQIDMPSLRSKRFQSSNSRGTACYAGYDMPGGPRSKRQENMKSSSRFGVHRQLQTELLKPGTRLRSRGKPRGETA